MGVWNQGEMRWEGTEPGLGEGGNDQKTSGNPWMTAKCLFVVF